MHWLIRVYGKSKFADHRGEALRQEWKRAGLRGVKTIRTGQAYQLADIDEAAARRLADRLLTDPVTQEVWLEREPGRAQGVRIAEIWPKKGVADPVADTVKLAAGDLGVTLRQARSGQVFDFGGDPSEADIRAFCEEHLMNGLIQEAEIR